MAKSEVYSSIMRGLSESLEYAKGNSSKARRMSVSVAEIPSFRDKEIKRIREGLNLSQKSFASVVGVSIKTVEAWESGKNIPQGTAQRFLQMLRVGGKKMLLDYDLISVAR